MSRLIGREQAIAELERAYASRREALISVVGRRRIGKTFLVQSTFAERIAFAVTGLQKASKQMQLAAFYEQIRRHFPDQEPLPEANDWLGAFFILSRHLEQAFVQNPDRCVVFFDELPWLASAKSGFLTAFAWFWNSWANTRRVVVVICGSAASWMVRKVVRDRGNLHNRITHRVVLQPFSLREAALFYESRGIQLDHAQQLMLYMALGGVPYYLEQIRPGESAVMAIQRLLFDTVAPLKDEFNLLFASLFDNSAEHIKIIRTLAAKRRGLTRTELLENKEIVSGGTTTLRLEELELSGFIEVYKAFGKRQRDALYRVVDPYSIFYLHFLDVNAKAYTASFLRVFDTPQFNSWAGFSFEGLCMAHVQQMTKALQIAGIYPTVSGYSARGNEEIPGVQIELLFDRPDQAITLIEAKFSQEPYTITSAYAKALDQKISAFRHHTGTRKQLFLVLIAPFGLRQNQHSIGRIHQVLTLEDLFG